MDGKNKVLYFGTGFLTAFLMLVILVGTAQMSQKTSISSKASAVTTVANYPPVPTMPGAVISSSACNDAQSMLFRASWEVQKGVPEVTAWYTTELKKMGWREDVVPGDPQAADIQYAEFNKGLFNSWLSKLQLSVTAEKNNMTKIEISFPAPDSEKEGNEG